MEWDERMTNYVERISMRLRKIEADHAYAVENLVKRLDDMDARMATLSLEIQRVSDMVDELSENSASVEGVDARMENLVTPDELAEIIRAGHAYLKARRGH